TRRPHSAPRPSRELVPASRTRTVHATSSAPSYESAHPALAARPARRTRRSPPALSTAPDPRTRTREPNSYGARYELGTQLRVGAPGTRRPTRRAHPTLTARTQHHARPANSYLRAELVRRTLRARHPATSRRTRHSPPDPTGAHGASA